ncbi:3-hydroxyacyl-CoA dehydrogenase NAD-binding domain-containing protein [Streptomyces brevispora]|uniref:3-hydroxyacyl-CoA dehydrogenase-like protein n=1 Tax=Streptomyces brevispora TaxID=887462 RepID=A0A561V413_9ACTN|nr:3-hydroxyacyl-CoA dehydrogenase-like protein [Streptomyces brevispora]
MSEFTRVGVVGCGLMGSGMAGVWRSRRAQRSRVHFFNPVPVQRLVEAISTQLASESVTRQMTSFVEGVLGKTVVRARDRAGFVVNALLVPYPVSAVRTLESGVASAEGIDSTAAAVWCAAAPTRCGPCASST